MNLAVEWAMLEKNPIKGVPRFNVDNQVEHYVDEAELARLVDLLQTDSNRNVCQIATFLLATGCRLNEALQATWEQVDLGGRVWKIPALNSKSKRIRLPIFFLLDQGEERLIESAQRGAAPLIMVLEIARVKDEDKSPCEMRQEP